MGDKITTIVTTVIILIVFMMMTAFLSADTQLDQAKQLVNSFAETVQYKGYITTDQYSKLVSDIPYNNMKLNITHIIRDKNIDSGTDNEDVTLQTTTYAPGTLDMKFNGQILSEMFEGSYDIDTDGDGSIDDEISGIYCFNIGDEVQVDLYVMEDTFFDVISRVVTGKSASPIKKITSESGVILNEKYPKGTIIREGAGA